MIQLISKRQFGRAAERAKRERMKVRLVGECEYTVENLTRGTKYRVRFLSINGKPFGKCSCPAGSPEKADAVPMPCKHLYSAAVVHAALKRMDSKAMRRSTRIR